MTDIKDTLKVNTQEAILGVEQGGFNFVSEFRAMRKWRRVLTAALAIAIIPGFLLARYGTEQFLSRQYGQKALSAHSAFQASQDPVVGKMTVIRNPSGGNYSAVVQITNPNLDLSASDINYKASFESSGGVVVASSSGTTYLLPNEKKYLVFSRIDSGNSPILSGKISFQEINWQKRLNLPEVKLRATEPVLYDETSPQNFVAEGSVINESPYQVGSLRLVFLLYNSSGEIIGVSQRDENRVPPFGRRAYKQLWPGLARNQVSRVEIFATTNTLQPSNLSSDAAPNTSPNPTDPFADPL
jgi:hypothetical protein